MDGLPGLEKVISEEFPKAKVPQKFEEAVADGMRSLFHAFSREKAREFFSALRANREAPPCENHQHPRKA